MPDQRTPHLQPDALANRGAAGTSRRRPGRPSINISTGERVGRVILGVAAMVAGVVLLASATSTLAVVLEAMLVTTGADLVVTGALGHCPLYQRLGCVPPSLRRQP